MVRIEFLSGGVVWLSLQKKPITLVVCVVNPMFLAIRRAM